jgi:hypothetical protein
LLNKFASIWENFLSDQRHVGTKTLNDGQLPTKFKTVMSYHKTPGEKRRLWDVLCVAEDTQRKRPQDGEMMSLHLPINKATESIQIKTV